MSSWQYWFTIEVRASQLAWSRERGSPIPALKNRVGALPIDNFNQMPWPSSG